MTATVFHWLIRNGLYNAVITWAVFALGAWLLAWLKLIPLWRHYKAQQERIVDLLDTDTPGGLKDVVEALREEPQPK